MLMVWNQVFFCFIQVSLLFIFFLVLERLFAHDELKRCHLDADQVQMEAYEGKKQQAKRQSDGHDHPARYHRTHKEGIVLLVIQQANRHTYANLKGECTNNHSQEPKIVVLSDAIINPFAVMVKVTHTPVTQSTVFGAAFDIRATNITVETAIQVSHYLLLFTIPILHQDLIHWVDAGSFEGCEDQDAERSEDKEIHNDLVMNGSVVGLDGSEEDDDLGKDHTVCNNLADFDASRKSVYFFVMISYIHSQLIISIYNFILRAMKASLPQQQLDPDQIRQGLISIRNTQLELLNQLKAETEMLKNYSPSTNSQYSSEHKWDKLPTFSFESPNKELQQKQRVGKEKDLKEQINYLQNQNKLLHSNIAKLKKSVQVEKSLGTELQSSLNFASKLFYHILNRIYEGDHPKSIAQFSLSQICKCNTHQLKVCFENILLLLRQKDRVEESKKDQGQKSIGSQLIELKSQLSLLINQSRFETNTPINQQSRIKAELQQKAKLIQQQRKGIQQKESYIKKIQGELKEMRQLWQKQIQQRKIATTQWQKLVKQSKLWQQKQKKIIFYAKDMQTKANRSDQIIKQKESNEVIQKQNYNKLLQSISLLREANQSLRQEVQELQESKGSKYQQLLQQKKMVENSLKQVRLQHQKMLENKQIQLNSLKCHLQQIKKNQQSYRQMERKLKESDYTHQEVYWRKVQIVRTNSTIDHLWQVKEVQYEHINQLINKMKA